MNIYKYHSCSNADSTPITLYCNSGTKPHKPQEIHHAIIWCLVYYLNKRLLMQCISYFCGQSQQCFSTTQSYQCK